MTRRNITILLNIILFFVVSYICYKFYYDVLYRMQIQVPLISKKYFWISSREFCLGLGLIYFLCLLIMRWWFSLVFLIPLLPLPIFVLKWMKYRYNYTHGFINGMIWYKELFNYNMNFYLFKTLEEWQKSWVVWKEIKSRTNATSFLVYGECRDFFKDPYIMHFFDDFRLDVNDSESFERIRGQLDIYQRAKIKLARVIIERDFYYYKAEHPIKYYSKQALDYVLEYPERIFLYSFVSIILGSILWFHIIEEPFYYKIFGSSVVEVASDGDSDSGSEGMFDYLIQALGKVHPGTSPDIIYYNLRQVLSDNIDLIAPLNHSLLHDINPEISRAVIEKLIPKVYNSQLVCVKIVDYLDNMNSPFEQFEVNVLQRISFFGLDFSFSNLTLYLVLAIIVILTLSYLITKGLSLIPNYWQSVIEIFYSFIFSMLIDQAGKKAKVFFPAIFSSFFFYFFECSDHSQLMMLGFFNPKKSVIFSSLTNNLSDFFTNILVLRRQYTSQAIMDNLVLKKKVSTINTMAADALCSKLIVPVSNTNITPHQMDLFFQQSIKKYKLTLSDLLKDFNLNTFFYNKPNLKLIHAQLLKNSNNHVLYQRTNTLGELTCIEACRRNFSYIKKMEMTWGQNINAKIAILTGNPKPDYASCIVLNNGIMHYYHADLKHTTILLFEKKVRHLHPNQIINTNIYWISDRNINDSYVFSGITKIRLENTYFGVLQFYKKMDPSLAREMHLNSHNAFTKFQRTGLAKDYNAIQINTPKFIFSSWINKIL